MRREEEVEEELEEYELEEGMENGINEFYFSQREPVFLYPLEALMLSSC